jgi:hypothetical protein
MGLNPGEVGILFIRRCDEDPEKYYLAVRSCGTYIEEKVDLIFGPWRIPMGEFTESPNFTVAFDRILNRVRDFAPVTKS